MYGWSVTHCLPTQLVEQPSAALGTVLRAGTLTTLAAEAGYSRAETLPVEHECFRLYRSTPESGASAGNRAGCPACRGWAAARSARACTPAPAPSGTGRCGAARSIAAGVGDQPDEELLVRLAVAGELDQLAAAEHVGVGDVGTWSERASDGGGRPECGLRVRVDLELEPLIGAAVLGVDADLARARWRPARRPSPSRRACARGRACRRRPTGPVGAWPPPRRARSGPPSAPPRREVRARFVVRVRAWRVCLLGQLGGGARKLRALPPLRLSSRYSTRGPALLTRARRAARGRTRRSCARRGR